MKFVSQVFYSSIKNKTKKSCSSFNNSKVSVRQIYILIFNSYNDYNLENWLNFIF